MVSELPRIFLWNDSHLSVAAPDDASASIYTTASLACVIRGLSICPSGEQWSSSKRKRRRPVLVSTTCNERSLPVGQQMKKLQDSQHHILKLPNNGQLKIRSANNNTYIVIYESWNNVKYLQVSNVEGYVMALSGVLFIPTIQENYTNARHYLSCFAHNSLWTNGTDILNNEGIMSTIWNEDLIADIPCIQLATKCSPTEEPAHASSWRTFIANGLQEATDGDNQYQEHQLRSMRRQYLYRQSLVVLNQVAADEASLKHDT